MESLFRKYPTLEQASALNVFLNENGIETVLANNIAPVDIAFSGNTVQNQYEIRISIEDFDKAEQLLKQRAEQENLTVSPDHYLFSFSNEELYDILINADEWNEFDYNLAIKILVEKGKPIDNELLNSLREQRLQTLAKPEENQKPWIIAGYTFAILGGFLGIIIGYFFGLQRKHYPMENKCIVILEATDFMVK